MRISYDAQLDALHIQWLDGALITERLAEREPSEWCLQRDLVVSRRGTIYLPLVEKNR